MEKESAALDFYYEELDPELRLRLLDQLPADSQTDLRRKLWELRYADPKDRTHRVDMFLWQIVNLLSIYKLARIGFTRKGCVKDTRAAMEALGFSVAAEYPGNNSLYRELCNGIRRYFGTCSSRSYGKKLFGIASMNDDERLDKIALEAWQLAEGLPERLDMREELEPLSRAVRDTYQALYGETRWRNVQTSRRSA